MNVNWEITGTLSKVELTKVVSDYILSNVPKGYKVTRLDFTLTGKKDDHNRYLAYEVSGVNFVLEKLPEIGVR
ncbi:hypothetical protein E6Q11_03475 [Candidatus Dojkabacteria bacterium]|uniref:Uncharacterized protein n=1 Tax=Candidatus Dojkabacteria bacterium TaxID=2099670 RepID=A0A5C7J7C0_9BACT|nr:MAG: hypothetical protein E6Q11_03475 [Candidatus Dojkabacteria bacterium]